MSKPNYAVMDKTSCFRVEDLVETKKRYVFRLVGLVGTFSSKKVGDKRFSFFRRQPKPR